MEKNAKKQVIVLDRYIHKYHVFITEQIPMSRIIHAGPVTLPCLPSSLYHFLKLPVTPLPVSISLISPIIDQIP